MDRETRKANLKKLQLPGTSVDKQRKTRQTAKSTATTNTAISNYFLTPKKQTENLEESTNSTNIQIKEPLSSDRNVNTTTRLRAKRTKLDAFIFKDPSNIPSSIKKPKKSLNDEDLIVPEKNVKKAPKLTQTKAKPSRSSKARKQTTIKTAFLRNEQLFAEIAAQHCAADQFDGDDVQLALAISKSEAEKTEGTKIADGNSKDVENNMGSIGDEMETIRVKLQMYGFRTAEKKDYNTFAAAFLPKINNRRLKSKWANKFTALTLRNSEIQQKKLQQNIESLLNNQFRIKPLNELEHMLPQYTLQSSLLKNARVHHEGKRILKNAAYVNLPNELLYVTELFEINQLPAGYLLKDWRTIQGRDLTPNPKDKPSCEQAEILKNIYQDLEEYFNSRKRLDWSSPSDCKSDYVIASSKENVDQNNESTAKENYHSNSHEIAKDVGNEELNGMIELIENIQKNDECVSQTTEINTSNSAYDKKILQLLPIPKSLDAMHVSSCSINTQATINTSQKNRSNSPDLFADSDVEMEEINKTEETLSNVEKNRDKENSLDDLKTDITTYEIFSSDEVKKTSLMELNKTGDKESMLKRSLECTDYDVIDLTQEDSQFNNMTKNNTLNQSKLIVEVDLFAESPLQDETSNSAGINSNSEQITNMQTDKPEDDFNFFTLSLEASDKDQIIWEKKTKESFKLSPNVKKTQKQIEDNLKNKEFAESPPQVENSNSADTKGNSQHITNMQIYKQEDGFNLGLETSDEEQSIFAKKTKKSFKLSPINTNSNFHQITNIKTGKEDDFKFTLSLETSDKEQLIIKKKTKKSLEISPQVKQTQKQLEEDLKHEEIAEFALHNDTSNYVATNINSQHITNMLLNKKELEEDDFKFTLSFENSDKEQIIWENKRKKYSKVLPKVRETQKQLEIDLKNKEFVESLLQDETSSSANTNSNSQRITNMLTGKQENNFNFTLSLETSDREQHILKKKTKKSFKLSPKVKKTQKQLEEEIAKFPLQSDPSNSVDTSSNSQHIRNMLIDKEELAEDNLKFSLSFENSDKEQLIWENKRKKSAKLLPKVKETQKQLEIDLKNKEFVESPLYDETSNSTDTSSNSQQIINMLTDKQENDFNFTLSLETTGKEQQTLKKKTEKSLLPKVKKTQNQLVEDLKHEEIAEFPLQDDTSNSADTNNETTDKELILKTKTEKSLLPKVRKTQNQLEEDLKHKKDDDIVLPEMAQTNRSFLNFEDKNYAMIETNIMKYNLSGNDTIFQELCNKYLNREIDNESNANGQEKIDLGKHSLQSIQTPNTLLQCDNFANISLDFNAADDIDLNRKRKSLSFTGKTPAKLCTANLSKSQSFNSCNSNISIDLTQNESDDKNDDEVPTMEEDDDCVVLSDDEINYSIWQANKTLNLETSKHSDHEENNTSLPSNSSFSDLEYKSLHKENIIEFPFNKENENKYSYLELEEKEKSLIKITLGPEESVSDFDILTSKYATSNAVDQEQMKFDRSEFGILEEHSQAMDYAPDLGTPTKVLTEASFLSSPTETTMPMKRYSRCRKSSNKFHDFLTDVPARSSPPTDYPEFEDFDGFDISMPTTPLKTTNSTKHPQGLDKLLTGEINFMETPKTPVASKKLPSETQEIKCKNKTYTVRYTNSPKPDYTTYSEAELLKQLHNYGIKPLKRKQAIKMLEYIYNQTHPIIMEDVEATNKYQDDAITLDDFEYPCTSKEALKLNKSNSKSAENLKIFLNDSEKKMAANLAETASKTLGLQDSCGLEILRYSSDLKAELHDEIYIFQTNVTKKTPQPLLPFHIAWYNLVCSNVKLHETILMYEPIDLQEIYLFLKSIGYRYDPKDLKTFFDRRCIIFRYDLTGAAGDSNKVKNSNRHVRKSKKSKTTMMKNL